MIENMINKKESRYFYQPGFDGNCEPRTHTRSTHKTVSPNTANDNKSKKNVKREAAAKGLCSMLRLIIQSEGYIHLQDESKNKILLDENSIDEIIKKVDAGESFYCKRALYSIKIGKKK